MLQLLLLSHFSHVRLCATPLTEAHQAPPTLGFSRQEHWSGLPFPSPMHESEKWKGSCSVMSDSSRLHGLQPTRLLHPWDFPGKSAGVGCHAFFIMYWQSTLKGVTLLNWYLLLIVLRVLKDVFIKTWTTSLMYWVVDTLLNRKYNVLTVW